MIFARRVFFIAGTYGLIVLLPLYFLETKNGHRLPAWLSRILSTTTAFIGVAVAWQPRLFHPSPAIRFAIVLLCWPPSSRKPHLDCRLSGLFLAGRWYLQMLLAGLIDLGLGVLFVMVVRADGSREIPIVSRVSLHPPGVFPSACDDGRSPGAGADDAPIRHLVGACWMRRASRRRSRSWASTRS